MATLIFFIAILAVIVILIRIVIKAVQYKNTVASFRLLTGVLLVYALLWTVFYSISSDKEVPLGTDICFDDWCATVTKIEKQETLGNEKPSGQFIILHIKMSNHARGIAQKPSEPRVHIKDDNGHSWAFSSQGQHALNNLIGNQISIDQRLELHESLETELVFDIPKEAKNLSILIEEGPLITKLLFQDDNTVFRIK